MNEKESVIGCYIVIALSCAFICLVSIVCRVLGLNDWPWLWVLSPLWIPNLLFIIALPLTFGYFAVKDKLLNKKKYITKDVYD